MNNLILLILACLGIFGFFVVLLGFLLLMRYLNYRENMKLAEKGYDVQQKPRRNKALLTWGWIITAIGLVGTLGSWALFAFFISPGLGLPLGLGPWVLLGLIPLFFGLVLLLIYVITTPSATEDSQLESNPSVVEDWSPAEEVANLQEDAYQISPEEEQENTDRSD